LSPIATRNIRNDVETQAGLYELEERFDPKISDEEEVVSPTDEEFGLNVPTEFLGGVKFTTIIVFFFSYIHDYFTASC
jgi:hypothetical protein